LTALKDWELNSEAKFGIIIFMLVYVYASAFAGGFRLLIFRFPLQTYGLKKS